MVDAYERLMYYSSSSSDIDKHPGPEGIEFMNFYNSTAYGF